MAWLPIMQGVAGLGSALLPMFARNDPSKQYAEYVRTMRRLANPETLAQYQRQLFAQSQAGPGFQQAQSDLMGASNQLRQEYGRAVGGAGAGTGIGNVGQALANSAYGFQLGGLKANLWNQSGQQAQNLIQQQMAAASQLPTMGPGGGPADYWGAALGGLSNFLGAYGRGMQQPGRGFNVGGFAQGNPYQYGQPWQWFGSSWR